MAATGQTRDQPPDEFQFREQQWQGQRRQKFRQDNGQQRDSKDIIVQ